MTLSEEHIKHKEDKHTVSLSFTPPAVLDLKT